MDARRLLDHCERHEGAILDTLQALARIESPSTDKRAVDACAAALAQRLQDQGARVALEPQSDRGTHVTAALDGNAGRPVLLLGHIDTVWPVGTLSRMPLRLDGGRLHGPGVFDMKGGVAIAIAALEALRACGADHPPIRMLWTSDEEVGSGTSRALIEATARECRAVLVLEPALPGGGLKTARKGCGEYELSVEGIAAHAGLDPGRGVSAIHELAAQIGILAGLQDLERGISVNVGVVSGGTRANVVAEHARAVVDVRSPTRAGAESIDQAIRGLQPTRPGARLTIRGGFERPPLERTAAVLRLFSMAADVAASLGRTLQEGAAGGGSDGNFTAALGVPTLDGLGPVGDGAHAAHEHVEISELPYRAALVAGLLNRLASTPELE